MDRSWVSQGVAFCELNQVVETEDFVFVLLNNFSMNAFSSAIEPLRIANQVTGKELFRWRCLSEDGQAVKCSNGISIGVEGTLDSVNCGDIVLVCSGLMPGRSFSKKVADKIRHFWRRGQIVGGICTGAYTLAGAGILEGSAFTLHWENWSAFSELYPDLNVLEQVFLCDGRIWTCAGGFAATDLMISHINKNYGKELAGTVANMCLYHTPRAEREPQKASTAAAIGVRNPKFLRILNFFEENFDEELNLDDVVDRFDLSRRQLERLFTQYLSTTPKKYLMSMRLYRARMMMSETNLSVSDVSAACGFGSPSHFSKCFKQKFGMSPRRFSIP
jgi:transcriptional regulator GlxA family with amidase domain